MTIIPYKLWECIISSVSLSFQNSLIAICKNMFYASISQFCALKRRTRQRSLHADPPNANTVAAYDSNVISQVAFIT